VATIVYGDRIGRQGTVLLVCSVVILDAERRVLLVRRTDNGRGCLPGGHFEPGESVTEAAIREVKEETGLDVEVIRLTGVYSSPDRVLEYDDGRQFHFVALSFEARVTSGSLTPSSETSEFCWCSHADVRTFDIMEHHIERIDDAMRADRAVQVR
jgi:ADP-ribose pyrophosphatase YjhB (NUDIX family)